MCPDLQGKVYLRSVVYESPGKAAYYQQYYFGALMAGLIYFWKVARVGSSKKKNQHICVWWWQGTKLESFPRKSRRASHLPRITLENHAQEGVGYHTCVSQPYSPNSPLSERLSQGCILLRPHELRDKCLTPIKLKCSQYALSFLS